MLKSVVAQGARYPYGVNTYESMSDQIKTGQLQNGMSDKTMAQLRQSQAYQKKADKQSEQIYKRKERLLALTNHWATMDKQLQYKTEYDKIIDQLKNTKLKGLTHEQLESRGKHLETLFKSTIR